MEAVRHGLFQGIGRATTGFRYIAMECGDPGQQREAVGDEAWLLQLLPKPEALGGICFADSDPAEFEFSAGPQVQGVHQVTRPGVLA